MSEDNSLILKNIEAVRERIRKAALRAGVNPDGVLLVAAAKTKDARAVMEAAAGADAIGENRVQEMLSKHGEGAYANIPLHFIGHLQKNKAGKVVGKAALIHSADSKELLEIISRHAAALNIVQDVLVEVNIADEPSKSGVRSGEVRTLLDLVADFPNIRIRGLMSIPPADAAISRICFQKIYKLFVDISHEKRHNVNMEYLSMGMSGDFEAAVEEGSNMVRVGAAIFGDR